MKKNTRLKINRAMAKTFFFFRVKEGELGVYMGDLLEEKEFFKDEHPGILLTQKYVEQFGLYVEYNHPTGIPVLKNKKKNPWPQKDKSSCSF